MPTDPKHRSPGYLPEGYKDSTRQWRVDGPKEGAACFQTEHWSGRLDAKVFPKPVALHVGAQMAQEA